MLELEPGGGAADLGCGVGTLAIVAAKLGCAPVVGVDRVPVAIEVARENAARNGGRGRVRGRRSRGRRRAAGPAAARQRAAAGARARGGGGRRARAARDRLRHRLRRGRRTSSRGYAAASRSRRALGTEDEWIALRLSVPEPRPGGRRGRRAGPARVRAGRRRAADHRVAAGRVRRAGGDPARARACSGSTSRRRRRRSASTRACSGRGRWTGAPARSPGTATAIPPGPAPIELVGHLRRARAARLDPRAVVHGTGRLGHALRGQGGDPLVYGAVVLSVNVSVLL